MSLLLTIVFGAIIGWLASVLMKTNSQMGIVANIVVGVIGAFLGNVLAGAVGIHVRDTAGSWIVAILGASLLIAILKALGVFRQLPAWR
jgi:uncharacterized membrane protein YeaQ/YmgE (transglycosylase-associated protein family)